MRRGRSGAHPSGDSGERSQLIQVATRCATIDEFVERFAAFAWEGSLVLPAASPLAVGTQGRFVILLRDQTVAMRGRCRVTEAKPTPVNSRNPAVKRVVMRVALLEMDEASRAIHKRLIALRSAPVPLPVPPEPSETTQIEPARQGSAPKIVPVPISPIPVPPIKTPPPAPPVNVPISRTIIGLGVGPDGRPILPPSAQAPAPVPAAAFAPTLIATVPRVETRVPGAPDTLPANPLSEFGADDVESFIECRLLEVGDESPGDIVPDGPTTADGPGEASPGRATALVRFQQLATKLPPGLQRLIAKIPPKGKTRIVRVAPFAAVALVSIIVGYLVRGTPPAPPAPAPAPVAKAAPAPAPAPEPEILPTEASVAQKPPAAAKPAAQKLAAAAPQKSAAVEKPARAEKPAPEPAAAPTIAPGEPGVCTARVITEPKDVKVIWGGQVIGNSPIDGARVPCGAAQVTLDRARWQEVTVDVSLQAGDTAVVRQRLRRPRSTLVLTSSPPGAQLTVNRVVIGTTPKQIEVSRFEKFPIRASLKGYQPWTKSVYLKQPETKIDIALVPRK
jgi:hypothetical protein